MNLTEQQKKFLRGLGHQLNPLVMVGESGLSDAVLAEFEQTLAHHELIKVRVRAGDREVRDAIIDTMCQQSGALLVQRVGNIALVYRPNLKKKPEKRIRLPAG